MMRRITLSIFSSLAACIPLMGSMITFPPEPESERYQDLICTTQDRAIIAEVITALAEQSKFSLLLNKGHMHSLGAQINHVHGLKFLSTIVTDEYLRSCLVDFFPDYFKRKGFMDGLAPSLSQEADKGLLDQYVADFAQEVGVATEEIQPFFQTRDWEGLVRFFIH